MLVHSSWPERCLCRCNGGCAVRLCQAIWWSFSGNLHGWEASTVICKRQEESSISGWAYWIWGQWIHSEWHCKYLYVYRTTQWMAYCRCTGTSYPGRLGEADKVALRWEISWCDKGCFGNGQSEYPQYRIALPDLPSGRSLPSGKPTWDPLYAEAWELVGYCGDWAVCFGQTMHREEPHPRSYDTQEYVATMV